MFLLQNIIILAMLLNKLPAFFLSLNTLFKYIYKRINVRTYIYDTPTNMSSVFSLSYSVGGSTKVD